MCVWCAAATMGCSGMWCVCVCDVLHACSSWVHGECVVAYELPHDTTTHGLSCENNRYTTRNLNEKMPPASENKCALNAAAFNTQHASAISNHIQKKVKTLRVEQTLYNNIDTNPGTQPT